MHGTMTRHRPVRESDSDALWWIGVATLLFILTLALVAADNAAPASDGVRPLTTTGPVADSFSPAASADGGTSQPARGRWSIQSASNGIVFVYHR